MLSSAACESVIRPGVVANVSGVSGAVDMGTFNEFATVDLTRCDFEGYDMVLGRSS